MPTYHATIVVPEGMDFSHPYRLFHILLITYHYFTPLQKAQAFSRPFVALTQAAKIAKQIALSQGDRGSYPAIP
jgi:hypothetical protein